MKTLNNFLIVLCFALVSCNNNGSLMDELDAELSKRPEYKADKERRITDLKEKLNATGITAEKQLYIYEELYEQYATYQFDSAMSIVNKQKELALKIGNKQEVYRSELHRIMLFATAGFYAEIETMLDSLPTQEFSENLKIEYFQTAEWAYNRLVDYMNDGRYSEQYRALGENFQDSLINALPEGSIDYYYWKGNREWNYNDADSLIEYFTYVYDRVKPEQRRYAQTTYDLSCLYARKGDKKQQQDFMIRAAISDQRAQLKESLALQELALQLKSEGEEARANRYLAYAMEDAQFYGNRLRLLQIANKAQTIVMDYERQLESTSYQQNIIIIAVGVLALLLVAALIALAIFMRRLHNEHKIIRRTSAELKAANEQTETANQQLHDVNKQLRYQTHLRENCISLFIELTAAYINKLNAFQLNVQRKVKAHQTADLLKLANPSRMSEQDAREFFMSFDKTFLSTFPHFVERTNALLRADERFILSDTTVLNLDLRILALMRLGIRDSAKIATLLNCSQQTVYNHRSAIKSRALNKDTFDEDLMNV